MPPTTVSVKILDKEFQVACQPEEVDELSASARYLDKQMRTIRESGKVLGLDRIAVMAALNITHEFLHLRGEHSESSKDADRRIGELLGRLDRAISETRQLPL
jgi:cell division protein ZapA